MPDQIDVPSPRRLLKLRSVSMREGPPDLLTSSKGHTALGKKPGTSVARLAPDRPSGPPFAQAPASRTQTVQEADDDLRPAFTVHRPPRPAQRERPDSELLPVLPRTRYRFGNALTGDDGPPPTPAVAVRLRQQRSSRHPGAASLAVTPLQRLDDAVRQRLWDQFSPRHLKRPPGAGR